LSGLS